MPAETLNIADYFLGERLRDGAGDHRAVITPERSYTYGEVAGLAATYRQRLIDQGVQPEQRVVIALTDGIEFVAGFFAILSAGAVVVMVNPYLPPQRLAPILQHTRAVAAFTTNDREPELTEAARGTSLATIIADPPGSEPPKAVASLDVAPTHRDDPAVWLFSGGTTGLPKAVVQTHGSFVNTTLLYAHGVLGIAKNDITIAVPKLYFGYATGSNLLFPFSVGATTVLFPEHPTARILFGHIRRYRPSLLITVPSMVAQMVEDPSAPREDLSCLRLATSAGEPLPPSLYQRWVKTFGVELLDGLGTAEMWHIFVSNKPGDVKPGTLGRPVPGFTVEVRDTDGNPAKPGDVGQLWVSGDSRALGYWRNLPKSMDVFRGRWVVTGDLVKIDDGYVCYVGRGDDAIKVKGKWLVPAEVEGCLLEHPAVTEAAVIGLPDDEGLLKPVAFVAVASDTPGLEQELKDFVLERLDAYKHPRAVRILDALPRTHYGKVDRGALKGMGQGVVAT